MKIIKKLLVVVMALALMATYFVIPASAAATSYDIAVAGTLVKSNNASNVLGDGKVSYDPNTNTLTLNNAEIDTSVDFIIGTIRTDGLNIEVKGTCTIANNKGNACGIYNNTSCVTIKGTGTLKIDMSNSTVDSNVYGILNATEDGGLTVCDSATLEIVTPDLGISTFKNIIVKDSATLKVTASSTAISGSDITISDDANVNITSGNYGIDGKNVTIEDNAIVNVTSGIAAIYATDTINFNGKINVNCLNKGTNINPTGDCKDNAGVFARKDIYFNLDDGGQVTAETKCTSNGYDAAFLVSSFDTITLNTEDGTKVILPVNGKASEVSVGWAITEADGTTYAKKATVKNEYKIKESADEAVWTKGSTTGQKLTSTADNEKFVSVTVDGKAAVEGTDFDRAPGSTIITFKPAFLEKLSVGKHTVVINSTDGAATGYLTIKEGATAVETEEVAKTGDGTVIGAFVALGVLSSVGYVTLKKKED